MSEFVYSICIGILSVLEAAIKIAVSSVVLIILMVTATILFIPGMLVLAWAAPVVSESIRYSGMD